MKYRLAFSTALLALAAPAMAQVIVVDPAPAVIVQPAPAVIVEPAPYVGERIYVPAVRPSGSPIHGGFVTFEDERLLGDAVAALSADRGLTNMTVTLVAKNGELIVNGVANDMSQAARAERMLKGVANGRVTSRFTTQSG